MFEIAEESANKRGLQRQPWEFIVSAEDFGHRHVDLNLAAPMRDERKVGLRGGPTGHVWGTEFEGLWGPELQQEEK